MAVSRDNLIKLIPSFIWILDLVPREACRTNWVYLLAGELSEVRSCGAAFSKCVRVQPCLLLEIKTVREPIQGLLDLYEGLEELLSWILHRLERSLCWRYPQVQRLLHDASVIWTGLCLIIFGLGWHLGLGLELKCLGTASESHD